MTETVNKSRNITENTTEDITENIAGKPGYRVEPLISEAELAAAVERLAAEIDAYYAGRGVQEILLVGILKGAGVFMADLMRRLQTPFTVDFIQASSYVGDRSSGELTIHKDLAADITGKNVLLVEDMIDTGMTLALLVPRILERNPADVKLCVALDKRGARRYDVEADFVGLDAPEKFLVGYGLDYNEYFRGLPYIGELILIS